MKFHSRHYLLIFAIIAIIYPLCHGGAPSKIVGGVDTSIYNCPSIASLQLYNQHTCGGSLITRCHVLTAAHCVFNRNWRLMRVATGSADQMTFRNFHEIKRVDIHSRYIGKSNMYLDDIAVITMKNCIVEDATQRPTGLYRIPLRNSVHGTVVGWGQLHHQIPLSARFLQRIDSWTISNDRCAMSYGYGVIRPSHVCTISSQGQGFCNGDSGGPFYVNGEVAGVVSMTSKCASGMPDIYTRVSNYIPWIQSIILNN